MVHDTCYTLHIHSLGDASLIAFSSFSAFLFEEIRRVDSESVNRISNQWMNRQIFLNVQTLLCSNCSLDHFASCKFHPWLPIYQSRVSRPDNAFAAVLCHPAPFAWKLVILKFHFVILNIPIYSSTHIGWKSKNMIPWQFYLFICAVLCQQASCAKLMRNSKQENVDRPTQPLGCLFPSYIFFVIFDLILTSTTFTSYFKYITQKICNALCTCIHDYNWDWSPWLPWCLCSIWESWMSGRREEEGGGKVARRPYCILIPPDIWYMDHSENEREGKWGGKERPISL